jgi:hypothetical protein
VKSILILVGTSVLLGAVVYFWFWSIPAAFFTLVLSIFLQFLVGWVVNSYRETKMAQYAYQQRIDEERILEANSITVKCAGCSVEHRVPVVINGRNTFKCRKCEAENVIVITTETALTTNPLE